MFNRGSKQTLVVGLERTSHMAQGRQIVWEIGFEHGNERLVLRRLQLLETRD